MKNGIMYCTSNTILNVILFQMSLNIVWDVVFFSLVLQVTVLLTNHLSKYDCFVASGSYCTYFHPCGSSKTLMGAKLLKVYWSGKYNDINLCVLILKCHYKCPCTPNQPLIVTYYFRFISCQ